MWRKITVLILLFYFFAILQSSFFAHFALFGATPNLVFILFFLVCFFAKKSDNYLIIIFAATAGIFLDVFSYSYLGPSIALLLIIGFALKKAQSLLKNKEDRYPVVYFLPLFTIFLVAYDLLLGASLYFLDSNRLRMDFGVQTIFYVIYNAAVASLLFYIYKKIPKPSGSKQISLFKKN